jgi:putative lipoic acid-binding regulatory protein
MFKAFGPNDGEFVAAVRLAVASVIPVAGDAMKVCPSSGGRHQSVSVLVRLHSLQQLHGVYAALKEVPRLSFLL